MKLINLFESRPTGGKEVIEMIKRDCGPFLKEIKKPDEFCLYRGMYPSARMEIIYGDKIVRADVRKQRSPVDTPKEISKFLDEWFERKFGSSFRSESVFCVGSRKIATKYGKPHVIFPKGQMDFCWSPVYADFYQDNAAVIDRDNSESDGYWDQFVDLLNKGKYQRTQMSKAISKFPTHEIMVNCDEYYAMTEDYYLKYFIPAWEAFK